MLKITPNEIQVVPASPLGASPEQNLSVINAPALWDLGWRGQGVVVATMDTGVDIDYHTDLLNRYRRGSNSWFDAYGQHTTPTDLSLGFSGHGTWTMGRR